MDRRVDAVGRRFAIELQRQLQTTSPRQTGKLQREQRVTYQRTPTTVTWTAEAPTEYARFVARGTKPHVIRPRRKKALAFFWPRTGKVAVFRSVRHPGTKPNRWWDDTLTDFRQLLSRVWRETEGIR